MCFYNKVYYISIGVLKIKWMILVWFFYVVCINDYWVFNVIVVYLSNVYFICNDVLKKILFEDLSMYI